MPRQIDSRDVDQRQTTQQRDARVAAVVQIDRFFKIEPPLPLRRCNAARNSRGSVGPVHMHFTRQLLRDVMTARASGPLVGLLQSENVDARQQRAIGECTRRCRDHSTDVLRASGELRRGETVVCAVTGHGLKAPDLVASLLA